MKEFTVLKPQLPTAVDTRPATAGLIAPACDHRRPNPAPAIHLLIGFVVKRRLTVTKHCTPNADIYPKCNQYD